MGRVEVTIAIPIYNVATFIEKSLRSCLVQSVFNLEILILNDCSTDNSIEVIKHVASDYQVLLSIYNAPQNCGVGAMRNKAVELAKGDYLYFLDSDDLMTEDCLETLLGEARLYDADLVIASHVDVCGENETIKKEEQNYFEQPDAFANYAFTKRYGYAEGVWNKLIRTDLLRREQLVFPDYRVGEDVPFIFQLITKVQRVVLLDKVTYRYIVRPGSLSQNNPRSMIPKKETDTHVASKFLLKEILAQNTEKAYYMPMLCIVMDYCLDTVRVMIEKRNVLEERVAPSVFKQIMHYPATLSQVLGYGGRRNVFNYLLCHTPFPLVSSYYNLKKYVKDLKRK